MLLFSQPLELVVRPRNGRLARPAAFALAGNMVGAIVTAGRVDGGAINLGLAPALLVVMVVLVWAGVGDRSLDARLATALGRRHSTAR